MRWAAQTNNASLRSQVCTNNKITRRARAFVGIDGRPLDANRIGQSGTDLKLLWAWRCERRADENHAEPGRNAREHCCNTWCGKESVRKERIWYVIGWVYQLNSEAGQRARDCSAGSTRCSMPDADRHQLQGRRRGSPSRASEPTHPLRMMPLENDWNFPATRVDPPQMHAIPLGFSLQSTVSREL